VTQTWEFTDLEFKVRWERCLHSRQLPEPLTFEDHERFDFGGSRITETATTSTVSRSDEFFAIPATRTGVITIHQGHSKFGPRGILERIMVWRDLPDDGRYVIELDQAPVAIGIGDERLMLEIDDVINLMVQRLETHWE
jgi:hypothetical protein